MKRIIAQLQIARALNISFKQAGKLLKEMDKELLSCTN